MGEVTLRRRMADAGERLRTGAAPSPEDVARILDCLAAADRRIDSLGRAVAALDEQLLEIEGSRFFRLLRAPGRFWRSWRGWVGQALLHTPLHPLYLKAFRPAADSRAYAAWVAQEQAAVPSDEWFKARVRQLAERPVISVVMPVYRPRRDWLEEAVESVRGQTYPYWELCACDDGSAETWVREFFAAASAADPRIRFAPLDSNQGISAATGRAVKLGSGEYAAFLDQDDTLPPYALHYIAEALESGPADLLYADEDRLDASGRRVEPIFKPAWSPALLLSCMYMGHLLVVRREAGERAGWLRAGFEGSQDYDLALRVAEGGGAVRHIPRVLYHWRKHEGSTAERAGAKPYTHEAGRRALADALGRRGIRAAVDDGPVPNTFRVRRELSGRARASIVICSRQQRLLKRCLRAVARRTAYASYEIVVVHHLSGDDAAMERLLATSRCVRVPYAGPFDFAVMNNLGARHASGEVLVFLNDDTVPLTAKWLGELMARLEDPEVGIAGARLLYRSTAIQHAGLATGIMHGVGHPGRDTFGSRWWPWLFLSREVSAVTGACLAVRRAVFEELGGFDPAFPVNYNDADLCLRAREAGYAVVHEASAVLRHDECGTRRPGIRYTERERLEERWNVRLAKGDPFYHPALAAGSEDAGLGDTVPGPDDNAR